MKPILPAILVTALLAACGGNPFIDGEAVPAPDGTSGTGNTANAPITRVEKKDTATGNGFAEKIRIIDVNPDTEGDEEFFVDGLAFDGDNSYGRAAAIPELGPFQVYEGDATAPDGAGNEVNQDVYRAVYGVSSTGKTNFAIVRTGSYLNYGFGGFVFKRNGVFSVPTEGFATYTGDYAGLRDFKGTSGLEYVSGKMNVEIDFNDFNDGAGINGTVTEREIYDIDGNPITNVVLDALNAKLADEDVNSVALEVLPVLQFAVGPGVLKPSGEVDGTISSRYKPGTGGGYEAGQFYALISNTDAGSAQEIVGIIKVESTDPRFTSPVTVRETGGFILYRPTTP